MNWRTLLSHELDEVERKIEAGEALDVGLLRSLVAMAKRMEVAVGEAYNEGYRDGREDGWGEGYESGYDDGIES